MHKQLACIFLVILSTTVSGFNQDTDWSSANSFHDFRAMDLSNTDVGMDKYQGQVVVVFNAATRSCPVSSKGLKQLEQLQQRYPDNLRVVTFVVDGLMKPSGSTAEIRDAIKGLNLSYDVYDKVETEGDSAHPVYKWIKSQLPADEKIAVGSKVLIDRDGKVVAKFGSTGPIVELEDAMKKLF